jgi:ribonuclease HII
MPAKDARGLPQLRDSKNLSKEGRRYVVAAHLGGKAVRCAVASVSARVIDEKGISVALRMAVREALRRADVDPRCSEVLLDGSLHAPSMFIQKTIVKGDEKIPIIALASSLAKLHRDRLMERYARRYPGYGFERHAGYGTKAHYAALKRLHPCPIHRKSFLQRSFR